MESVGRDGVHFPSPILPARRTYNPNYLHFRISSLCVIAFYYRSIFERLVEWNVHLMDFNHSHRGTLAHHHMLLATLHSLVISYCNCIYAVGSW